LADPRTNPEHRQALQRWMLSYRPYELFDDDGAPIAAMPDLHPPGDRRMSAKPDTNGGTMARDLHQPDLTDYAVEVKEPGRTTAEATRVLGRR
jgi:xylulose-5-phosphate/fructose-6-phosphate phosphoketolase